MRIRSGRARWLVFAAVIALVVAACSSGGSASTTAAPAGSSTSTSTTAAPAGSSTTAAPTGDAGGSELSGTIRVWTHQNEAFNNGLHALADSFMAENPGVTIEFETFAYNTYIQTLQTALPAGTEADVLQMFGTWTCSYASNLAPVPSDLSSVENARSIFFEAAIEGYVCDDSLYGFPLEFNIEYGATLFNKAIAAEVGASGDWNSWDDFVADAQAMTETVDGNIVRAGYNFTSLDGLPYTFYSNILQAGGSYLGDNGFTVNTSEGKQALELMMSWVDAGIIDPLLFNQDSNWVGDSYFDGTSAMGLVGPWVIPLFANDFPDVAAATEYRLLPTLNGSPDFVADSGWGLTVAKSSKVQDVAWAFVSYVALNAENAASWNSASGTLPALKANAEGAAKDALIADFPYFEPFFGLLKWGHFVGTMPDRDLVWYDITYPHLLNALQGNESIDEALAAIEKEANESFNN